MIPGSEAARATHALEQGARGNPWSRRLTFGLVLLGIWIRYARQNDVEIWRFPVLMLLAVAVLEIAIAVLKRYERDHGLSDEALTPVRRRGTLIATAALAGVMLLGAAAFAEPWYAVLGVLFAYVGFLFSRYVPDALFGSAQEQL